MTGAGPALLLTASPGTGKTTVLRRVVADLADRRLAGFYTEEIRQDGQRRGFRLVTLDGRQAVMADVDLRGPDRVGRYGVDVAVVNGLAADALAVRADVEVYLVDEIGAMECRSSRFVTAMRALLDSPVPVVATIARRGGGFIAEVKRRGDIALWEVTRANRDAMPARVLAWLRESPRPTFSPER